MADNKPTPEEELLKLIEKPSEVKKATPAAGSPRREKTNAPKGKAGLLAAIAGFFESSDQGLAKGSKAEGESASAVLTFIDIKVINRVLVGFVILALIYLLLDVLFLGVDRRAFLGQVGTGEPVYPQVGESLRGGVHEVSYYLSPLERRNPFLMPSEELEAEEGASLDIMQPQTSWLTEKLQGLQLVGISWAEEPVAMVEDVATGRTHFLRKGQIVKGVKIQSVTKDKVIVSYEGEEGVIF